MAWHKNLVAEVHCKQKIVVSRMSWEGRELKRRMGLISDEQLPNRWRHIFWVSILNFRQLLFQLEIFLLCHLSALRYSRWTNFISEGLTVWEAMVEKCMEFYKLQLKMEQTFKILCKWNFWKWNKNLWNAWNKKPHLKSRTTCLNGVQSKPKKTCLV